MRLSTSTAQGAVRTISVIAVILAILTWTCAGFMQLQARRAAAMQAQETILNLVLGLEHDIERTIASFDLSLQATQHGLKLAGLRQLAPDLREAMLFDGSLKADYFGRIAVIDAQGDVIYSSRGPPGAAISVADRGYFQAHRANPALGLVIDGPVETRLSPQRAITLSRRLNNEDGSFAGVVVGSIQLRYFENLSMRLNLGPDHVFLVEFPGGEVVVQLPTPGAAEAIDMDTSARLRDVSTASFERRSPQDGIVRQLTFQKVGPFPLVVGVGLSTTEIYDGWMRQATISALLLVVMTLIGGFLVLLLRDELARRRRSEQSALQAAAQIAMLTDHSNDIIMHIGWDGIRRFVSSGCERMVGYTAAEIVDSAWIGFVHPEDQPMLTAAFAAVRAGGNVGLLAYRVRGGDGAWRNVETNCRALPNEAGAIFVIRDVTERTRLEERLRQAQRREAIGQLTAGVAHDFNNMLQAQLSTLEHLGDTVNPAGDAEVDRVRALHLVGRAVEMAERGARMTHQLLSFSRQQVLRPAVVSLARVLPDLGTLLRQMLGARVQVSTQIGPATPPVLVDAAYLEGALLNLALNARDSMPAGGRLTIAACPAESVEADPPPELEGAGGYVVVSVTDDGMGMDEAILRRACEPFFTTKGTNGTGLGLASVQGFVRQSGGDMRISSTVGTGTRVELWLPIAVHDVAPTADAPSPSVAGSAARILLVDDEPGVLEVLGSGLRLAGFEVEPAGDAEAAMAILTGAPFHALVTDFLLPGLDGAELIEQARMSCPGIATVLITGWAGTERLRELPPETEVIYKPFRRDELIARIRRAIAASAAEQPGQMATSGEVRE